ncbi:MAG: G-rich domain on putative tyrosine kinase, partial [Chloroflexota bacterium]|nr:G-rich domain on putative tyrosine kinase [Chloroflexota bacterium]
YAALLAFSSAGAANVLTVIEPAVPPDSSISPRPLLNAILAAAVGLLLAGVVVLVIAYLEDRSRKIADPT